MRGLAVVAIGGNSLIRDGLHLTIEDQYEAICETAGHIAGIMEKGLSVIITHGNGPQVGFILRRSEIANMVAAMHRVPLVSCVADTEGSIGYQIQQAMHNEFYRRGWEKTAVTVISQVVVSLDDPAFAKPAKPIGSFYAQDEARGIQKDHPDWVMVEDAGRGWRRVVASPKPREIVEKDAICALSRAGYCVIAMGGGGIPVVREPDGTLQGVDAVIDKDLAASLLADAVNADLLIISTAVPGIYLDYGRPEARLLPEARVADLKRYAAEAQFAAGSMLPKIQAAVNFLENKGKRVIITDPASLEEALAGRAGSNLYP